MRPEVVHPHFSTPQHLRECLHVPSSGCTSQPKPHSHQNESKTCPYLALAIVSALLCVAFSAGKLSPSSSRNPHILYRQATLGNQVELPGSVRFCHGMD